MTYTNFTLDIDADGIALVTWDMPDRSMNVFTEQVMQELSAIVDKVAGDAAVKGAVVHLRQGQLLRRRRHVQLQNMLPPSPPKPQGPREASRRYSRRRLHEPSVPGA